MLITPVLLPAALVLPSLLFGSASAEDPVPPPGMVFVEGGRTEIGTTPKEVEALLNDFPAMRKHAGHFIAETPRKKIAVDGFFLMVNEVTNEQFAVYVETTGSRPPQNWGEDSINTAREQDLESQEQVRQAAKDRGEKPPAWVRFEKSEWWRENWKSAEWTVPEDLAHKPVVYIDYQDCTAYARWAGLRLMSEIEYQRAVRGDGKDPYPWGDQWEDGKFAATSEMKRVSDIFPVGTFPEGVSRDGIHDLAGNVWEWTQSRFTALEGFKPVTLTVGRGRDKDKIDNLPNWNPDRRVVVGGSIQNPRLMARCTTRAGTDRFQQISSVGFRCASSTKPGLDLAQILLEAMPADVRPTDVNGPMSYQAAQALALQRWQTRESELERIEGYQVITGHDHALFVPILQVHAVNPSDLRKSSLEDGLLHLGFFSTDQPMIEPNIEPGSYLVAFRGKGESPEKPEDETEASGEDEVAEVEDSKPLEEFVQFDPAVDNFIMMDMTGEPVAAMPVARFVWGNPNVLDSKVGFRDRTIIEIVDEEEVEVHQEWLEFDVFVKGRTSKGLKTTFGVRLKEKAREDSWGS
ncbi:MAG TPA: SUMF1/EgtB/PvdO family nonheme iron enzyme [Planctomycetota bacterium]|nr:SUMF1/EgtB/PvdO family nonheme iron enzyme [Planctomycetota bacterium]